MTIAIVKNARLRRLRRRRDRVYDALDQAKGDREPYSVDTEMERFLRLKAWDCHQILMAEERGRLLAHARANPGWH